MSSEGVYVSTVAFIPKTIEETLSLAKLHGWSIEFSSGMPFRTDMESIYRSAEVKRIPHNYFPAPESPFVLNLASQNEEIRNRSIDMCINGLKLAALSHSPFFSAHAGFCVDPKPEELGNPLTRVEQFNRPRHWEIFKSSLAQILPEAKSLGLRFLIENNVLAKMNLYDDGRNPLFCCDARECELLIEEMKSDSLGLLLDTGHWKVSANTLGFSQESILSLVPNTHCIHHSDNDGDHDTNGKLSSDYWFKAFAGRFRHALQVIEVKKLNAQEIESQIKFVQEITR